MNKKHTGQAEQARFLRKLQKQGGVDQEEEEQDRNFNQDVEKALKAHSKKAVTKDLEKQIEYFGYKMEPFNMKDQQEMGQIDEDGFFVFSKKRNMKDAWLDSLKDNQDEGAVDVLRKKIKQQNRFQNVYEADRKVNENYQSDQEDQLNQQSNHDKQQQNQEEQKGDTFAASDIKLLLAELLPFNQNANKYLKTLKKQKNTELYDKILYLCNEYIASTGEHDILSLKKQELQQIQEKEQQEPLNNWDVDENSNEKLQFEPQQGKQEDHQDQDDIF